ncbi:hypothetical protein QBC36DRAFT_352940 [Triangularia setosa]|uniref:Uncharacterized protein n=1 Tax=Triangularia setosa TaxID=2587417 RepID=A0AAN6W6R6_9PEZI|nr:hypothetical protein QBC36DRAFT_352940 [Podospora setosa]
MMFSHNQFLTVLFLIHPHPGLAQEASTHEYSTTMSTSNYTSASIATPSTPQTPVAAAASSTPESQPSSGPPLSTGAQAGIITGCALLSFLLLSLAVYFFRLRKRNKQSLSPSPNSHPGLSTRPSNQHLISSSSPTSQGTLQTPRRARTPLSLPFSNPKRGGGREQQGIIPLSPSTFDIVRERLEMESMGFGYQQDRRREAKSVVESLDWDWKKVYVYPFASSVASSCGSVYSTSEGAAGGLEEGKVGQGLGSYWNVSSGGSTGGRGAPGGSRR